MKATAKAPSNIAFIKYWGKSDSKLRLPVNSSVSMSLSDIYTITTVEFSNKYSCDEIFIDNNIAKDREYERVIKHLDRIRKLANISLKTKVVSKNNFPKSAGLSSSASAFAALTLAAAKALNLNLDEKQLSILARFGSGSACRSIGSGFVKWEKGKNSQSSYAYSLYPPQHWQLCDVIAVVANEQKKVSTTLGMSRAKTSPFYKIRQKNIEKKIKAIEQAIKRKDFSCFGNIIEQEALELHTIALTSVPPLLYWVGETVRLMHTIWQWRRDGLPCYFTINTGHSVHILCQPKDEKEVIKRLKKLNFVKQIFSNKVDGGAKTINKHLF